MRGDSIQYEILASGSKGNCLVLNGEIAIDMGVSFKKIKPYLQTLKIVLLTHRHFDHFNRTTIKTLARERPLLRFCAPEYLHGDLIGCGVAPSQIDVVSNRLSYGEFLGVQTHQLFHDVPNVGYTLTLASGETVFYATDTGCISHINAPNLDYYFIEGNYDEDEIQERIRAKEERGEYVYEYRVRETHLSIQKATEWVLGMAGEHSKIEFMHEHI